jgi:hypothetical protein
MSAIPKSVLPNACFVIIYFFIRLLLFNSFSVSVRALAKNSSFGFSALAFVSAKTKSRFIGTSCAVCAVGFLYVAQRFGYA